MAAYIKELKNKNNDTVYPITDINAVVDNENQKTLKNILNRGVLGNGAKTTGDGGAIGYNASSNGGGGAIGYKTRAFNGGGAIGDNANADGGGAIGRSTMVSDGGAIGLNAKTGNGFAGGANARCYDELDEVYIDSIQLGSGNNQESKTLQVYDYQLMDRNGIIPVERIPYRQYSTRPQRIGTWIDNTPIWRVAFPYIRMQNGVRELRINESSFNIRVTSVPNLYTHFVNDSQKADLMINCSINYYSEYERLMTQVPIKQGTAIFCENNATLFEDLITFENGFWGGYIDFVTPESNIKK